MLLIKLPLEITQFLAFNYSCGRAKPPASFSTLPPFGYSNEHTLSSRKKVLSSLKFFSSVLTPPEFPFGGLCSNPQVSGHEDDDNDEIACGFSTLNL